MKILILDPGMYALDFGMRARDCGHEVKFYTPDNPRTKDIGRGLVERISDWRPWARWASYILLPDNLRFLEALEPWRREGVKVIGATPASAKLEIDRKAGMEAFKKAGIEVPPYREFSSYPDAIAYVKREGRAMVSKPCGEVTDKSLSYVGKTPADLVYKLDSWRKAGKKMKFVLQDLVRGSEMAVGAFCGPHGFNSGILENWEFKKLMNGDLGVATGEQGTVIRSVKQSKLFDKVLKPLEEMLVRSGHCSYVDINCIVDDDGTPWPLEFTCRPGWPTFCIQQALLHDDPAEWLMDLANGKDSNPFDYDTIATGVVASLPDYPYSHATRKEVTGIPVYGLTPKLMERFHPCEMMLGMAPQDINGKVVDMECLVSAGDYLAVASGTGQTVRESAKNAYKVLDQIKIPGSAMWRTDIGARLKKQLPVLQSNGYATGMNY